MRTLKAPLSYRKAHVLDRKKICNACGSSSVLVDFVPDNLFGLDISEACNIHDWMYQKGKTSNHKKVADDTFLTNMFRLIDNAGGNVLLRWIRKAAAKTYHLAVKQFGDSAFWSGKK